MAAWLSAVSIGAGYCFGAIVGLVFYERHREVRRKKRAKEALGTDSVLQASSVSLESGGFGSWLIEKAIQFSVDEYNLPSSLLKAGSYGFSKKACLFEKAGINRGANREWLCVCTYLLLDRRIACGRFARCLFFVASCCHWGNCGSDMGLEQAVEGDQRRGSLSCLIC